MSVRVMPFLSLLNQYIPAQRQLDRAIIRGRAYRFARAFRPAHQVRQAMNFLAALSNDKVKPRALIAHSAPGAGRSPERSRGLGGHGCVNLHRIIDIVATDGTRFHFDLAEWFGLSYHVNESHVDGPELGAIQSWPLFI